MRALGVLLLALLACACQTTGGRKSAPRSPEVEERYQQAIAEKRIMLGMEPAAVVASWGRPRKKDRVRRHSRRVERWWYPSTFIYFGDGHVVGWDSPGW